MFRPGSASTPINVGFSPETDFQRDTLTNDGFWPDLNLADFQKSRTIPVDIPSALIRNALLSAVVEVNAALTDAQAAHQSSGFSQAVDVPGPRFADKNALCAQYEKAVFARAKADLMGEFVALGHKGEFSNQDGNETRETLLAEAAFVLRSLQGAPRVGVLIV